MRKKDIIRGAVIGLIANSVGLVTAAIVLSKLSGRSDRILTVLETAQSDNFLGKLISLGAIFNLLSFFYFIRKRQDGHACGVLIVTVLIALGTFLIKL